jgi:hypothetical protein
MMAYWKKILKKIIDLSLHSSYEHDFLRTLNLRSNCFGRLIHEHLEINQALDLYHA